MSNLPVNQLEASLLGRLDVLQTAFAEFLKLQAQFNPLGKEYYQGLHQELLKGLSEVDAKARELILEGAGVLNTFKQRSERIEHGDRRLPEVVSDEEALTKDTMHEYFLEKLDKSSSKKLRVIPGFKPEEHCVGELAKVEDFASLDESGIYIGSLTGQAEEGENAFTLVLKVSATSLLLHDFTSGGCLFFTYVGAEDQWVSHINPRYFKKDAVLKAAQAYLKARSASTVASLDAAYMEAPLSKLVAYFNEHPDEVLETGKAVARTQLGKEIAITLPEATLIVRTGAEGLEWHVTKGTVETFTWERLTADSQAYLYDGVLGLASQLPDAEKPALITAEKPE